MKNKKVIVDHIKNAVILLLSLFTVFLLSKTMLFSKDSMAMIKDLFSVPSRNITNSYDDTGMLASSILPDIMVTTDKKGGHYAIKYSTAELMEVYTSFAASLAEALGTAGSAQQINSSDFKIALSEHHGIFFDFPSYMPIRTLAESLRTEASGSIKNFESCRFYLCLDNEEPYIYFIDAEKGNFYRCKADISVSYFTSKLEDYPGRNDLYIFETQEYKNTNIDQFFTLSNQTYQVPGLNMQPLIPDELKSDYLLKTFKMSERTSNHYTESDGSTTYVDGSRSMKLEKNGDLRYSTNGESAISLVNSRNDVNSKDALISGSIVFLQKNFVPYMGDSMLIYSGFSDDGSSEYSTLYFDYFVAGVKVAYPEGIHAVELEIKDGKIIKANMKLKKYTVSGSLMHPLPDKQLAAALLDTGGIPNLKYMDTPQGITVGWYLN